MSLIRFRKRLQIDADNNLYARDPQNPDQFIIVGNVDGPDEITAEQDLSQTIRYRNAARIDELGDLYLRVGNEFVVVGNAEGFLDNTINNFVENDYVEDYFE
jgi:hypothetical protein